MKRSGIWSMIGSYRGWLMNSFAPEDSRNLEHIRIIMIRITTEIPYEMRHLCQVFVGTAAGLVD